MIKAPMSLQKRRRRIYRKAKSKASAGGGGVTRISLPVKATDRRDRTHNPSDETCWVSRLRENLTSGSDGEGLETGRRRTLAGHEGGNPGYRQGQSCYALPRQSFTRQLVFKRLKTLLEMGHLPKFDPASSRAWLYGKLFLALLTEKLARITRAFSPWGYPLS